jgi:hypothetical protein
MGTLKGSPVTLKTVILSGASASHSEALAESKDPYHPSRPTAYQGVL